MKQAIDTLSSRGFKLTALAQAIWPEAKEQTAYNRLQGRLRHNKEFSNQEKEAASRFFKALASEIKQAEFSVWVIEFEKEGC